MLLEFHVIKHYPPTVLNRDDSGSPKTCIVGGATRARISSQCLKRSWRTSEFFVEDIGEAFLSVRTRAMPDAVLEKLLAKKLTKVQPIGL